MKMSEQNNQVENPTLQTSENLNQAKHTVGETIRFGIVGVMNTVVDFVIFLILANVWHWNVLAAQTVSYLFGLINSYIWNRKITFKSKDKPKTSEVVRFITVNVLSYLASIIVLSVLGQFSVSNIVSKIIAIFATFSINFVGSKWWVFRQQSKKMKQFF